MDKLLQIIQDIQEAFRNLVSRINKLEVDNLSLAGSEPDASHLSQANFITNVITTTPEDVTNLDALSEGDYLVYGFMQVVPDVGDDAQSVFLLCNVDGVDLTPIATFTISYGSYPVLIPVKQIWHITVAAGVIKSYTLRVYKGGGTGSSYIQLANSYVAVYGSPA